MNKFFDVCVIVVLVVLVVVLLAEAGEPTAELILDIVQH